MHKASLLGALARTGPVPPTVPAPCALVSRFLLGTRLQAKSGVSGRKQRIATHSTRYTKGRGLASRDPLLASEFSGNLSKINRDINLIESALNHCKQRPATPINRNISGHLRPQLNERISNYGPLYSVPASDPSRPAPIHRGFTPTPLTGAMQRYSFAHNLLTGNRSPARFEPFNSRGSTAVSQPKAERN